MSHETIAGHRATIFQDGPATTPGFAAIWPEGDYGVELRDQFPDLEAFLQIADSIRRVDIDTWLAAMPETVVEAEGRSSAIRQMLADIPVPDDFDTNALIDTLTTTTGSVSDRYQLGARVTGRIASHHWDILQERPRHRL